MKKHKFEAEKYTYRTEWSAEDNAFVAYVLEFPSLSAHGPTSLKAHEELLSVVKDIVKDLAKNGEAVPEPLGLQKYAGKIPLRVSPELHRRLKIEAAEQQISLNQYLLTKLSAR